jgi:hypothetical protein
MAINKFKNACGKHSPSNFNFFLDQAKGWSKDGRQYLNKVGNEDETDDQTWDRKIRVIG